MITISTSPTFVLVSLILLQFADDERVQANRLRRAPQWETFLKYLEGRGKLRR